MWHLFQPGRLTRTFLALPLAILASSLAPASDNPMGTRAASEMPPHASGQPNASGQTKRLSNFDYLVLASMADSMQPITLAGYQYSGAAAGHPAVNASGHSNNKGNLQCHL
jgi:hypothetical protein